MSPESMKLDTVDIHGLTIGGAAAAEASCVRLSASRPLHPHPSSPTTNCYKLGMTVSFRAREPLV